MIYFFILCIILFGVLYYDITNHKYKEKTYFYFNILLLILISGFSYRLGSDVINYMEEYETEIKTISSISYDYIFNSYDRQCGWQLFLTLIKTISPSFTVFKIIHSYIINTVIGVFIYKYFKYKFVALLCYFFFLYIPFNFEVLRESLAVSCFLYATKYFLEKKYLKYYLFTGIAFSLHISAFILFLFPLSKLFLNNKLKLYVILSVCLVSLLFISQTQQLFYYLIFIPSIANKAFTYFSSETHGASRFSISNLINYVFNIVIPIILLAKAQNTDKRIYKFAPQIIVYVIIYCMSMHISILFRFNNYFNIFYIFAYIEAFSSKLLLPRLSIGKRKAILVLAIMVFCFLKLNVLKLPINGIPGYYRYYPYSSIFDKKKEPIREKLYFSLQSL